MAALVHIGGEPLCVMPVYNRCKYFWVYLGCLTGPASCASCHCTCTRGVLFDCFKKMQFARPKLLTVSQSPQQPRYLIPETSLFNMKNNREDEYITPCGLIL